MSADSEIYKSAERRLRGVRTEKELHAVYGEKCALLMDDVGESRNFQVFPGVRVLRQFLDPVEQEQLTTHILNECIDAPHDNSLDLEISSLFAEYTYICENEPKKIHSAGLRKLRWSCIGSHYDWTKRQYGGGGPTLASDDSLLAPCSPFPVDHPLQVVYRKAVGISRSEPENAQSALINFYHSHREGDRLGGHRDDVEKSEGALVLLSLGLPGIFIVVGPRSDSENIAWVILLRSGDAVVLEGEGRKAMHGVPGILSSELPPPDGTVSDFLKRTRISCSIRRVV